MKDKQINTDLKHFNKAELLNMVGDNAEFHKLLLNTYFEGFSKYLRNIRTSIQEQDQALLKLNAHSITGSSRSVCFELMANMAFKLENTPVAEKDKVKSLIEDMENELEIIKELIVL